MATADEYAQWIVNNEDKKGSEDFNTVVKAYQEAKAEETAMATPSKEGPVSPEVGAIAGAVVPAAVGNFSLANPYGTTLSEAGQALKSGVQTAASKVGSANLGTAGSLAADAYAALHGLPPVATIGKKIIQSAMPGSGTTIAEGLSALGQGAKGMAGGLANAGRFVATGAMAPENLFTLPYQMAAYEQAKIRANPYAPEYATNPYAMSYRSQDTATPITQRQAGAMNARNAVANVATGYTPNPQEAQNILASGDERMINMYGGRLKLKGLASPGPNAFNSGFAQQLNTMGR
jgi:hypothetical protein